jgi:hypothetical protein
LPPQVIAYVVAWALFAFQRMIWWDSVHAGPLRLVWRGGVAAVSVLAAAIAMSIGKP